VNALQYRLLRLLATHGKDIFVIGDPDQAIYGFRGADVQYFTHFQDDYPDANIVKLTRSYRSTDINRSYGVIYQVLHILISIDCLLKTLKLKMF